MKYGAVVAGSPGIHETEEEEYACEQNMHVKQLRLNLFDDDSSDGSAASMVRSHLFAYCTCLEVCCVVQMPTSFARVLNYRRLDLQNSKTCKS